MSFKDQLTADLDAVFFNTEEFAETATYNGTAISAIWDDGANLARISEGVEAEAVIEVKASDVPAPVLRDIVIRNGVTYRVLRVTKGDGYVTQIALARDQRPTLR